VNSKDSSSDNLTPLHYASYTGNPEMLKLLISYGAELNCRSKMGADVLHLAAQGDSAYSLAFFKLRYDLKFDGRDNDRSTPLHWAVLNCSEIAIQFILGMTPREKWS